MFFTSAFVLLSLLNLAKPSAYNHESWITSHTSDQITSHDNFNIQSNSGSFIKTIYTDYECNSGLYSLTLQLDSIINTTQTNITNKSISIGLIPTHCISLLDTTDDQKLGMQKKKRKNIKKIYIVFDSKTRS